MPTKIIDRDHVLKFLEGNSLAVISTVTKEGKPDGSAVYYLIEKNFDIFFITKKGTAKYKNIHHLNEVVLTVTNTATNETVKIKGKAEPVNKAALNIEIMENVAGKLNRDDDFETVLPILKHDAGEILAIKITPYQITMSDYSGEEANEAVFSF